MGTRQALGSFLSFLFLILAAASPARADHITTDPIPPDWAGIWEVTVTRYECGSTVPIDSHTKLDTLCTGDDVSFLSPDYLFCGADIDSTSIHSECSRDIELRCTYDIGISVLVTRTGDTLSGTGYYDIFLSEGCLPGRDECYEESYSGVRIAPEPPDCAGPVQVISTTWGELKAIYR
jgi:transcriptional regulator with XRE-family HTH domain